MNVTTQQVETLLEPLSLDLIFSKVFKQISPDFIYSGYYIVMDANNQLKGIKLRGLKNITISADKL